MVDVRPFFAVRPRADVAGSVISPPYDVVDEEEARAIAADNPLTFLHVTRPEVGMPRGTLPAQRVVWERGRDNLLRFIREGVLVRDDQAAYYVYGQRSPQHTQMGFLAAASVDEYDRGVIRKHELTLPEKEDDRTRHLETLDAQVGLVFLAYQANAELAEILHILSATEPDWRVTTDDQVEHAMWRVPAAYNAQIRSAFASLPALYIADGHHRSAAASRVHALRRDEPTAWFLAGLFPDDTLQVLAYHRVVEDLGALTPEAFLQAVESAGFDVITGTPLPAARGMVSMYLAGVWYLLRPPTAWLEAADPVATLDISVLQDRLLGPILGITDPRTDRRLRFVGGNRGPEVLERLADASGGVAFHLHPTGLDQLFDVCDAGRVMPPKSTWFEPKLREGVVVRLLDRVPPAGDVG